MDNPQPNDWVPVPAQPAKADDWVPAGASNDNVPAPATSADIMGYPSYEVMKPLIEPVLDAFGEGFKEGYGPDRLGLSPENIKYLSDKGIFGPEKGGYQTPFQAFYELLGQAVVGTADLALRGSSGIFRGTQAAVVAAGLPRDIAALPEAFFGSPHPTGMFRETVPKPGKLGIEPDQLHIDITPTSGRQPIGPFLPLETKPGEVPAAVDLGQARDLGVIGPEQPLPEPTLNDSPSKLAEHAVPSNLSAARTPKEEIEIRGHSPGEYDERGKQWINKIDESDDVRDVVEKIASENDFFPMARGGEVSAATRNAVAEAAGVDSADIDASHLSMTFDSDGKVRAVIQTLRQTAKDFASASKAALDNPTPENLAAAAEAELRHTHVVEYTLGLRAESGRTLAAWKDLLRQTEETRAKVALRAKEPTGEVPKGTTDIIDAVGDVRENLKTPDKKPGLQKLIDAARNLVDNADKPPSEKTTAPISPEAKYLVDEARKALKQFGGEKDEQLETFREALTKLTQGNGALGETVEAARAVVAKTAKAESAVETEPKVISAKSQLKAAAKRLVDAARRVASAAKPKNIKEAAQLMPDVKEIIDNAQSAVKELQGQRKSALDKLIDQAEQQAVNMTRQKQVKEPTEALPPELQGLIDKTGRIVDRFGGIARGERAALLLARTGKTFAEQEQLARSISGLTPNQIAKVLGKLRTSEEAGKPGWFYWLWQQGLISGLITHSKYAIVNTATLFMERVIAPTFGALLDRARGENTSMVGPLYANIAMVHALPDAIAGAAEAFKTGLRVPLKSEIRLFERGEESPQTKGAAGAYTHTPSPDWGIWERVFNETQLDKAAKILGIPGKSANMLHTFYKILSENASRSTRAFQAAHEEGVSGDTFWQRYRYHLDSPTDDALRGAVNDAYTGAFMAELSPKLKAFANTLSKNPVTKWLFPFQHIPWNIQRISMAYSPLATLGPEMRSAILGNKGVPAQNLAIAKMTVGSSVLGYFLHQALSGQATGDYPQDMQERHRWEMLRIRPNSIQIGGEWVSYERLGPIGNVAHMGASIGQIIHNYDGQDDDALTSAIWAASIAAANQIGNEVGFQSLKNLIESLENKHKAGRFVAWQAGSFIPFSSFVSQNASAIDPYQRKADSLIDGLKYRVPFLRETLLPKRDPISGEPLPNPSYHTITPMAPVTTDPIRFEMDSLKYYPGPLSDRIGGVKLTPELYDRYQAVAGSLVRNQLEYLQNQPGWTSLPSIVRHEAFKGAIKTGHESAAKLMQVANPEIIQQGIDDTVSLINGQKPLRKLQQ